jgi:hypothetical protein
VLDFTLLNTTSFLFNQIVQHRVATPNKIWFISFRGIPSSHGPNKSEKLEGGWIPYVICMVFQINLAKWQSKNKCCIVSMELQKQHLRLPCQFLFARLPFVRVTYFQRYHKFFSVVLWYSKGYIWRGLLHIELYYKMW